MKLIAISLVRDEEYWIWYSLTSVLPYVDEILLFDNHSRDDTLAIVGRMEHLGEKLVVHPSFGGASEQHSREEMLEIARRRGGTHVLFLDGDEVHADEPLAFLRRLLEWHEHVPALADPPRNSVPPRDHTPTDGALIKNIGIRPIHPGYAGPDTCRPLDLQQRETDHGCYSYAIRIASLANLRGNGLEWGRHGYLETGDLYLQSSPHTLWLPKAYYFHFSFHPRSRNREVGVGYGRHAKDLGSMPLPAHVALPRVLFRSDGPGNPTLEAWRLREDYVLPRGTTTPGPVRPAAVSC